MKIKLTLIGLLLFTIGNLIAQEDSLSIVKKEKRINYTALPIVFYLPETSFAFGGMGMATFRFKGEDKESRASQIIIGGAYTLKKQLLFYSPYQFYFKDEKNWVLGELGYYRYFFNFHGLGPDSKKENRETYQVNFPRFYNRYIRNIKGRHFGGMGFKYDYFDIVKLKEGGLLEENQYLGTNGGGTWMTTLSYIFDNRDHLFFPEKGFFIDLTTDLSTEKFISPYSFARTTLDARSYHKIGKRLVLANQLYFSHATDGTPFYYLPYLSVSPGVGRGYADRRFIDHYIGHLQSEIRFPIWKKFQGTTFIGLANVGDTIQSNSLKISGGMGLRFVVNKKEKTRARLDLGFTPEGFNFYITFNEAF